MSVKIGICDDDTEDIRNLTEALYLYDPSFEISTYTNGESLVEDYDESKVLFDILFLDIYMDGLNGIETAKMIFDKIQETKIVFVSSSDEYYSDAYNVFAFNYMIKPINYEKLNQILDKALTHISVERSQRISFSYQGKTYRVFCRDIQYIESRDKIIYFHMADKNILMCYAKLDEILAQLPEKLFIRCHQSFAVNIIHITEMGENYFRIDPTVISISKKYQNAVKNKYFAYLFSHLNRGL